MTLALGGVGPGVGALHQHLLELGYDLPKDELDERRFGVGTLAAVVDFQAVHVDERGQRLEPDGIVGPATSWAVAHPQGPEHKFTAAGWRYDSTKIRQEALRTCYAAICDLGRREQPDGSNDGPEIAKFDPQKMPWCAQAVSVWLESVEGGSPFGKRLRSVAKILAWAEKNKRVVSDAIPGDLWAVTRAGGHGHVELVVGVEPEGLMCVGGNVGNAVRGTIRQASAGVIVRAIPKF